MTPINRFHPAGFNKAKLRSLLEERNLRGILLTSPEDVFYTTGYTALPSSGNPILYTLRNRLPSFSFIDCAGRVTLLCWGFSAQGVNFGADEVVGFNSLASAKDAIKSILQRSPASPGLLGITSTCPYYVLQVIEGSGLGGNFAVVDEVLEFLRLIKSDAEIALLQKSAEIMEKTCLEVYEVLRLGMGRSELTREAKYRLIKNGATGVSHITVSFAQANPEVDIDEPLEKGRLVTIDLGAIYQGYASDTRRYAYTGPIPESLAGRYRHMVAIVDAVGSALVPGASYREVFQRAVDQYDQHGIRPLARFNHVGHNIGLETEERWLDDSPEARVEAGMVINIELYSTAETGEQIGDEETYVISESGPRRISQLPREIRVIN